MSDHPAPVPAPRDPDDERRQYLAAQDDVDALRLELTALHESMKDYGASRGW
jgi:hypothetical protein